MVRCNPEKLARRDKQNRDSRVPACSAATLPEPAPTVQFKMHGASHLAFAARRQQLRVRLVIKVVAQIVIRSVSLHGIRQPARQRARTD